MAELHGGAEDDDNRSGHMRSRILGALLAGFSLLAARLTADDFDDRAALFRYDAAASLLVQENGVEKQGSASVHDIRFTPVPGQDPVNAYLVVPEGKGPFAGVLWVHWLGEPATTNRTEFLKEAVSLAPKGVVSLLVDAMWSAPEWYVKRVPEADYENSIRQVVAIRRAMDLLVARGDVDKARVGYVGHDYGGMYGMIANGLDRRARTHVYIAVVPSLSAWAFFSRQPASKVEYLRKNAVLELTEYVRQVRGASTLFQFAKNDVYVSRADSAVLMGAAADPKERRFYDADHAMAVAPAVSDRDAWLLKELGLGGPGLPPLPSPSPSPSASPVARAAPAAPRVDFAQDVRPILEARCQPCHFEGGRMYARLPFDRVETIRTLGDRLFTRIKTEDEQALIRRFLSQVQ
jgi:dienelactone hydrolase